jgi:hypothetical protein
MDVECPAHAYAVRDDVWMLQGKVHGVVTAKAATGNRQARRLVFPANKRNEFMQNVALVLQMPHDAHSRVDVLVVPTFQINGIRTKDLELAALDLIGKNADHPAVFIFEIPSHGSGEDENWSACVAKDQRFHVSVELLAVSLVVFAIHFSGASMDGVSYLPFTARATAPNGVHCFRFWALLCAPIRNGKVGDGMGGRICQAVFLIPIYFFATLAAAQTNCEEGNGLLDFSQPKTMTVPEVIQKFTAAESRVRDARIQYTYTQDALLQTLAGNKADGEFHEVTTVSYDAKGRRLENVTYAQQTTLRRIHMSQTDVDDIRTFMPFMLTTEELPQYNLIYAGQQHVDDLDTYVFHVEPRKEEKDRRYFQGRVWVDRQDLQIVKTCGKSVPESIHVKKNEHQDLRPSFVGYRQQVDGHFWFPAYVRSDDTLQFRNASIHVREIVKFSNYKSAAASLTAGPSPKP